jgi:hypothetical protein
MTIAALVTALQDAQPFLQFVADVFGGAQGADHDSAADSGRAALGAVAEENEQAARERARTTYKTALAAALGAAETCTAGVTNPMTTASDLRGKVRALNLAARANKSDQVDDGLVPLSTDAPVVRAGCAALHDSLRSGLNAWIV